MSSFAEESTSFGWRSRTPAVHLSTHGQVTDYLLTLRSYGLTDPIPQDLVTGALSTVLNDWFSVFGLALGQAVLDIVKIVSPMSATAYRHSPSFPSQTLPASLFPPSLSSHTARIRKSVCCELIIRHSHHLPSTLSNYWSTTTPSTILSTPASAQSLSPSMPACTSSFRSTSRYGRRMPGQVHSTRF